MYYYKRRKQISEGWLTAGIAATCLGLVVIFNYESSEDKARKPEVIERFLESSQEHCSLTRDLPGASYEYRYRRTLSKSYTTDLEKIENAGINICLDERLNGQDRALFSSSAMGIYYPEENTLTMYDLGSRIDSVFNSLGLLSKRIPREFIDDVMEGSLPMDQMAVSHKYTVSSGKSSTTHIRFRSAERMAGALNRNPELRQAPVIQPPS